MPHADDRAGAAIEELAAEAAASGGVLAVAARHVSMGLALDLRAEERFPSASVIKVPILVELMARHEAGECGLVDRVRLEDAEKVPGSGVLSMLHAGLELTLEDLAHLMITVSDNTASNMLIDILGCDRINARMADLGFVQTRLERKFYDFEARDRGLDNWATAGELADLMLRIEQRRVVSPKACGKMLAILRKQQFDGRIPRLLPPDTPVANKTGSITGICHDAGIVYAPTGPIAMAVLTRGFDCPAAAEGLIRHVARTLYYHWGVPDGGGVRPAA